MIISPNLLTTEWKSLSKQSNFFYLEEKINTKNLRLNFSKAVDSSRCPLRLEIVVQAIHENLTKKQFKVEDLNSAEIQNLVKNLDLIKKKIISHNKNFTSTWYGYVLAWFRIGVINEKTFDSIIQTVKEQGSRKILSAPSVDAEGKIVSPSQSTIESENEFFEEATNLNLSGQIVLSEVTNVKNENVVEDSHSKTDSSVVNHNLQLAKAPSVIQSGQIVLRNHSNGLIKGYNQHQALLDIPAEPFTISEMSSSELRDKRSKSLELLIKESNDRSFDKTRIIHFVNVWERDSKSNKQRKENALRNQTEELFIIRDPALINSPLEIQYVNSGISQTYHIESMSIDLIHFVNYLFSHEHSLKLFKSYGYFIEDKELAEKRIMEATCPFVIYTDFISQEESIHKFNPIDLKAKPLSNNLQELKHLYILIPLPGNYFAKQPLSQQFSGLNIPAFMNMITDPENQLKLLAQVEIYKNLLKDKKDQISYEDLKIEARKIMGKSGKDYCLIKADVKNPPFNYYSEGPACGMHLFIKTEDDYELKHVSIEVTAPCNPSRLNDYFWQLNCHLGSKKKSAASMAYMANPKIDFNQLYGLSRVFADVERIAEAPQLQMSNDHSLFTSVVKAKESMIKDMQMILKRAKDATLTQMQFHLDTDSTFLELYHFRRKLLPAIAPDKHEKHQELQQIAILLLGSLNNSWEHFNEVMTSNGFKVDQETMSRLDQDILKPENKESSDSSVATSQSQKPFPQYSISMMMDIILENIAIAYNKNFDFDRYDALGNAIRLSYYSQTVKWVAIGLECLAVMDAEIFGKKEKMATLASLYDKIQKMLKRLDYNLKTNQNAQIEIILNAPNGGLKDLLGQLWGELKDLSKTIKTTETAGSSIAYQRFLAIQN